MDKQEDLPLYEKESEEMELNERSRKYWMIMLIGSCIGTVSGVVVYFIPLGFLIGVIFVSLCCSAAIAKRKQVIEEDTDDFDNKLDILIGAYLIFLRGAIVVIIVISDLDRLFFCLISLFGVLLEGVCFALSFKNSKTNPRVGDKAPINFNNLGFENGNFLKIWEEKTILYFVIRLVQFNLINENGNSSINEKLKNHEQEIWKTFVDLNIKKLEGKRVTSRQCSAEQNNPIHINALSDILSIIDHVIQMPGVESISEVATKTSEHVTLLSQNSQSQWLEFLLANSRSEK